MRKISFLLILAIAIAVVACKKQENYNATDTTTTTGTTETYATPTGTVAVNDHDKDFITGAAKAGKAEIDLAQDALQHATSADVKSFAQKIIDDHTKANDELAKIAANRNVTIPTEARAGFKEMKERLMKLTGATFDEAFTQQMTDDHEAVIKDYADAAQNAADSDVKAFANKTLPGLREHLKMAQDLHAKVSKKK